MAKSQIFTQTQLESAKQKLADLPDLSKDKITTADAMQSLKEQIVDLASKKGYTIAEIKTALEGVGMTVTAKAISDLIDSSKKRRTPNKGANKA